MGSDKTEMQNRILNHSKLWMEIANFYSLNEKVEERAWKGGKRGVLHISLTHSCWIPTVYGSLAKGDVENKNGMG